MCYSCHIKLSDEKINEQLNSLKFNNETFNIFNSTSLFHLIYSSSGYNGLKNRYLSINTLIKYYHWNIDKNKIIENNKLSNIIKYLLNNTIDHANKIELNNYIQKIN